ncbi:hypothetical protein BJ878DRAFT_539909 [Calycina marina]|uniref:DUF8004 domain-containing protein n=1 Tax=Calycina marina TaxID=1763456 RepID=A0A9P7Z769_9HELO|nr:hypothetical protein BJ878DRAFT_539909 [Calycina marina]
MAHHIEEYVKRFGDWATQSISTASKLLFAKSRAETINIRAQITNSSQTNAGFHEDRLMQSPDETRPIQDQDDDDNKNEEDDDAQQTSFKVTGKLRKLHKGASGMFGGKRQDASGPDSKGTSGEEMRREDGQGQSVQAWIEQPEGLVEHSLQYLFTDTDALVWGNDANLYVFASSKDSQRGPIFMVPRTIFENSAQLSKTVYLDEFDLRNVHYHSSLDDPSCQACDLVASQPTHQSTVEVLRLNFPLKLSDDALRNPSPADIFALVNFTNLIAFLTTQPLINISELSTRFQAFVGISQLLMEHGFNCPDGTSYGAHATECFKAYLNDTMLEEVRESNHNIVQGLILGERMRSEKMYTEAFAHAAGNYDEIKKTHQRLKILVSQQTWTKLERASMEMKRNLHGVTRHIEGFNFPSIFSGIAASTSNTEYRNIRFDTWRASFEILRKKTNEYYKDLYSKDAVRYPFRTRIGLLQLYNDMRSVYDLLVDREQPTTRSSNPDKFKIPIDGDVTAKVLRILLDEYDRSSPPVRPAIPYDLPLLPTIATVMPGYHRYRETEQVTASRRALKEHEQQLVLTKSYNQASLTIKTPFAEMFMQLESSQSKQSAQTLSDRRIGYWIFLYAVIQTLPLVVINAVGIREAAETKYFLCAPAGSMPWVDGTSDRVMFAVRNSSNMVQLPASVVQNGIEGIYSRSHCWADTKDWSMMDDNVGKFTIEGLDTATGAVSALSPLQPPRSVFRVDSGRPSSSGTHRVPTPSVRAVPSSTDGARQLGREEEKLERQNRRSVAKSLTPVTGPCSTSGHPTSQSSSRRTSSSLDPPELTLATSRPGSQDEFPMQYHQRGDVSGYTERGISNQSSPVTTPELEGTMRFPDDEDGEIAPRPKGGPKTFDEILGTTGSVTCKKQKKKKSFFQKS